MVSTERLKVTYTEDEIAALKERADGMLRVVESSESAIQKAAKDVREAYSTLLDVCRVAACEIDRAIDAIRDYHYCLATVPSLPSPPPAEEGKETR